MVKLNELLLLPSLREATVLSGKKNLHRSVNSLSFLEISDMSFFANTIQNTQQEYYAGELLIGSFYTIKDDLQKQYETIQQLHNLGEIGIILYYVGIILLAVSDEIIKFADELGFVIICMPLNDKTLRYNEVIYEVMEAILTEQTQNENILSDTLEKVSLLPEHLRSVEITLKMLSDQLKANIILTNNNYTIINQVMWPRNSTLNIKNILQSKKTNNLSELQTLKNNEIFVYQKEIQQKETGKLQLFAIKEKNEISSFEINQLAEISQVALNLWGKKHGEISEYALVKAIIHDESDNMFRLAKILAIDVSAIEVMWLVHINDLTKENIIREELEDQLSKFYQICVVQLVDHCFVVLLGNYLHKYSELEITKEFVETSSFSATIKNIVFCPRMRNTSDVRNMYQATITVESLLTTIYRNRKIFSSAEIRSLCKAIDWSKSGEQEVTKQLAILSPIVNDSESMKTLATFLLDSNGHFDLCGKLLFIHKNTVKYRIKKISELLGYNVTNFSETYDIYMALMIYRLLTQEI